mgnify:CR=1 FL=1
MVISDENMPGMKGHTFLAEVRKLLKEAGDHPNVRGFQLESITHASGVDSSDKGGGNG